VSKPERLEHDRIPEEAVRGNSISHKIGFGLVESLPHVDVWNVEYPDGSDPPIFVARFRYRSAALLQSMAMIPRPVPLAPRPESAALGLLRRSTRRVAQQQVIIPSIRLMRNIR